MAFIDAIRRTVGRGSTPAAHESGVSATAMSVQAPAPAVIPTATGPAIEIAPNDSLFAYLQWASGVVDAERLELDSPALGELRAAGIRLVVPLVAQGELIGALYLGPRLSDQDYSTDDRRLLTTLTAQ